MSADVLGASRRSGTRSRAPPGRHCTGSLRSSAGASIETTARTIRWTGRWWRAAEVAEACLAHVPRSQVVQAYQRFDSKGPSTCDPSPSATARPTWREGPWVGWYVVGHSASQVGDRLARLAQGGRCRVHLVLQPVDSVFQPTGARVGQLHQPKRAAEGRECHANVPGPPWAVSMLQRLSVSFVQTSSRAYSPREFRTK